MTLANKITQVLGVQFYNMPSVYCILCSQPKVKFCFYFTDVLVCYVLGLSHILYFSNSWKYTRSPEIIMYSAYEWVSQNLCQFGYLPTWKVSQMGALKKVMAFSKLLLTNVSVVANRCQCCFLFRLSTEVEHLPQHIIDSYQPGVELGLEEKITTLQLYTRIYSYVGCAKECVSGGFYQELRSRTVTVCQGGYSQILTF